MPVPGYYSLSTSRQSVHIGSGALERLPELLANHKVSRTLVVADQNTAIHCRGRLEAVLGPIELLVLPAGEKHKQLEGCQAIWRHLTAGHYDRKACVINLGGGLIGDLGGFAASCYKRGIGFVQVPTSLLAMVDASVGSKTGINFMGFKNQIGAFQDPWEVLIEPRFLKTLPPRELLSGYAEVLKHTLIADRIRWEALSALPGLPAAWEEVILDSVKLKAAVVEDDPYEQGRRAILNFGHTLGHALESHALAHWTEPLLHGEAVAIGMVCEAFIAHNKGLLNASGLEQITQTLFKVFGKHDLQEEDLEAVLQLCQQDKKNMGASVRLALLNGIGDCLYGQDASRAELLASLHYYQHYPWK